VDGFFEFVPHFDDLIDLFLIFDDDVFDLGVADDVDHLVDDGILIDANAF